MGRRAPVQTERLSHSWSIVIWIIYAMWKKKAVTLASTVTNVLETLYYDQTLNTAWKARVQMRFYFIPAERNRSQLLLSRRSISENKLFKCLDI